MSVSQNVICCRRLTGTVSRLAATVVDGVDEAAQFELYSLSHRLLRAYRARGVVGMTAHFDVTPIHVETWDDLMNIGKQKKAAKYVEAPIWWHRMTAVV